MSVTGWHGLQVTPRRSDIPVTPAGNLLRTSKLWISNPTATGFDIVGDASPGPAGAEFALRFDAPGDFEEK